MTNAFIVLKGTAQDFYAVLVRFFVKTCERGDFKGNLAFCENLNYKK